MKIRNMLARDVTTLAIGQDLSIGRRRTPQDEHIAWLIDEQKTSWVMGI